MLPNAERARVLEAHLERPARYRPANHAGRENGPKSSGNNVDDRDPHLAERRGSPGAAVAVTQVGSLESLEGHDLDDTVFGVYSANVAREKRRLDGAAGLSLDDEDVARWIGRDAADPSDLFARRGDCPRALESHT